jgi:hypothetical protein
MATIPRNRISSGLTIPPAASINATAGARRTVSGAGARALVPVTYGEDRQAGLILNIVAGATAGVLLVQVLWGYACESISAPRLNDQPLPDGATMTHYTGAQSTPDAAMVAGFAAQTISYSDTLAGYAYSVLAMPVTSFDGQLSVTALVRGRRVYDPRKDSTAGGTGAHRRHLAATWEWSDNPALALADWTADAVYGAGEPVDWSTVGPAAAQCDALVGSGSPEKRRRIGVTLTGGSTVAQVADTLRAYAGCWLVPSAAGQRLVPDVAGTSVAGYDHAAGQIERIASLTLRDLGNMPTAVEVVYTDRAQLPWREESATAKLPGAGTTAPWRLSTVRLPGVPTYSQAYREALERLNKLNLGNLSTTVDVFDIGVRHEKGDIITLTAPFGFSAKPMRVTDVDMPSAGRWSLQVTEHDPAAYTDEVVTRPTYPDAGRVIGNASGNAAPLLQLIATGFAFIFSSPTSVTSDSPAIDLTAQVQNLSGTGTLIATAYNSAGVSLGPVTLTGLWPNKTLSVAAFLAPGGTAVRYVRITAELDGLVDYLTVYRGDSGSSGLTLVFGNEFIGLPTDADGDNPILTNATSWVRLYEGITEVTADWSITISAVNCAASLFRGGTNVGLGPATGNATVRVDVTDILADTAQVQVTATRSGQPTISRPIQLVRVRAGAAGAPGTDGVGATSYSRLITVYQQAVERPTRPVGGSYLFTGDAFTAPAGWSRTQPDSSGVATWGSTYQFITTDPDTAVEVPLLAASHALWQSMTPGVWTLTDGGRTAEVSSGSGRITVRASQSRNAGKRYFEVRSVSSGEFGFGGSDQIGLSRTPTAGQEPAAAGIAYERSGSILVGGTTVASVPALVATDVVRWAHDIPTGKVWVGRNGTWLSGNPAAGTSPIATITAGVAYTPVVTSELGTACQVTLNADLSTFAHDVPAGFSGWSDDPPMWSLPFRVNDPAVSDALFNQVGKLDTPASWLDPAFGIVQEISYTTTYPCAVQLSANAIAEEVFPESGNAIEWFVVRGVTGEQTMLGSMLGQPSGTLSLRNISILYPPTGSLGIGETILFRLIARKLGGNPDMILREAQMRAVVMPSKAAALSGSSGTDPNLSNVSLLLLGNGPNGSSSVLDSSPAARTPATNTNVFIDSSTSKFGGASLVAGSAANYLRYVDAPGFDFPGDFTVEAWVYPTSTSGSRGLVVHRVMDNAAAGTWTFGIRDGKLMWENASPGSITIVEQGTVPTFAWSHVAVCRSGSTIRLFVGGAQVHAYTDSTDFTNGQDLHIGVYGAFGGTAPANFTGFWAGNIDDLRITKGVARYVTAFTPPAAQLPVT